MDFPQPQMIDVNGVSLEVFTAGQGTPLVLCHGWPEHAYSWRYQIQPLVDAGYHVIVPNQRTARPLWLRASGLCRSRLGSDRGVEFSDDASGPGQRRGQFKCAVYAARRV